MISKLIKYKNKLMSASNIIDSYIGSKNEFIPTENVKQYREDRLQAFYELEIEFNKEIRILRDELRAIKIEHADLLEVYNQLFYESFNKYEDKI